MSETNALKTTNSSGVNILLIEDNPGDIRILKELLAEAVDFKHSFYSASTLSEGLKIIEDNQFNMILLDLNLPDSSGIETVIKVKEKVQNIPIIVLTGLDDAKLARSIIQTGAQDYLVKGQINSNPLARSISYAIERHRMIKTIESLVDTVQKNENRLKKIIDTNTDKIIIVDEENIVRYANSPALKYFEKKSEKFIGSKFNLLKPSKEIEEIHFYSQNKEKRYAEIGSVEISWDGYKSFLLTIRDITDRKQAEEKLKESEEKYRLLVENSLEGIWSIDSNSITTFVNQRMAEILGYTVNEMLGKHLFFFMDEQGKTVAELDIERRKQGIKETHEFEFLRKDGTRIYTKLETSPLFKEDGSYNGAIAYVVDITEKKEAEEKLKESEEKYRGLFESIKDGILMTDMIGNILDCNQAYLDMLGYTKNEIKNKSYIELTPGKWHKLEEDLIHKQIIPNGFSDLYEKEYIRKDGTIFPINIKVWLIRDKNKKPSGMWALIRDITDLKRTEELIINLAKFPSENPNPVFRANEKFVLHSNQVAQNLLKIRDGRAVPGIFRGHILNSLKHNKQFTFEMDITNRFYIFEISPVVKAGYVNFYGREITEQKIIAQKLKESEKKYRDLYENSPYPSLIENLNGDIIDCNSGLEKLTGYSKNEIINRNYKQSLLFPTEYLPLYNEAHKKLLEGNIPDPIEVSLLKKKGERIWLNLKYAIMDFGKEKLIHILIQNITEIKRSREEVKELENSLKEMEALIENAPFAILLLHQNGKVLRVNEVAKELWGYSEAEFLNLNISDLFSSEYLDLIKGHYQREIYNISNSQNIEVEILSKNGKRINVEVTSTVLKIKDNVIIQTFFSDITERKNTESHRQLLLDQLLTSLEFKSKFLATISHELRTPLNAILGFSQLLLDKEYGEITPDQKDFLSDINSAGKDLLILIDSILDFSRVEAGKLTLNLEQFKLKSFIEEIETQIKPLYNKKGLQFIKEGFENEREIYADSFRLKQIFYNLLGNAIKYTEVGYVKSRIIEKKDHWEFQISDSGIGIAKEDYDVIFREFGRIENDKIKHVPGAGLGLALTQRLIQLHGGEIWFESEVKKGTTFFFTIPKNIKI